MYVRSIVIDKAEEDDALLRNACVEPVKEDAVKAEAVTAKPAKMQERTFMVKAKRRCTNVMACGTTIRKPVTKIRVLDFDGIRISAAGWYWVDGGG